MGRCSALNCTNAAEKGTKMFRVPWDHERRMQWAVAIRRKKENGDLWVPGLGARSCSAHFVEGTRGDDPIHIDYVPSIFNYGDDSRARSYRKIERHRRKVVVAKKSAEAQERESETHRAPSECAPDMCSSDTSQGQDCNDLTVDPVCCSSTSVDEGAQTLECRNLCTNCSTLTSECQALKDNLQRLKRRCQKLKSQLSTQQDVGIMTEKNVAFYTALLSAITAVLPQQRKSLPYPSQLLLFLMRLRHGLQITGLAYRLDVSIGTASRIFKLWLGPMSSLCRQLIVFPEPDVARSWLTNNETLHFPKLRGIIDCTEGPVLRPFNLSTQQEVWSYYKQDSTLKFLVCINPHGAITFVSKVYGRRISDKKIRIESGFIAKLRPGDQVLADRGYLLHEGFFLQGVQLVTPAFTKGKTQLLANEVESSRRIPSSRIIVERAIGHLKKWKMLSNTVPYPVVQRFDDILTVVAGLTNIAP